jgi:hypothetical protein
VFEFLLFLYLLLISLLGNCLGHWFWTSNDWNFLLLFLFNFHRWNYCLSVLLLNNTWIFSRCCWFCSICWFSSCSCLSCSCFWSSRFWFLCILFCLKLLFNCKIMDFAYKVSFLSRFCLRKSPTKLFWRWWLNPYLFSILLLNWLVKSSNFWLLYMW